MIAAIRLPEVGNFMTLNIVDIEFFKRRNKVRNYLHFDQKISNKKLFEYVTDKEFVSRNSFFPTISYSLKEEKISKKNKKNCKKVLTFVSQNDIIIMGENNNNIKKDLKVDLMTRVGEL